MSKALESARLETLRQLEKPKYQRIRKMAFNVHVVHRDPFTYVCLTYHDGTQYHGFSKRNRYIQKGVPVDQPDFVRGQSIAIGNALDAALNDNEQSTTC